LSRGRLLAALAVVAATLSPATARGHDAAQPPPERTDVSVEVGNMTGTLTPDSPKLVIRARAVNTTAEPVRNLQAGLRIGAQLRGRSSIAQGGTPARFGTRVADKAVPAGELAPFGTAELEFDVPLAQLPFDHTSTNGVYPLRLEVRSRFEVVGAVDTYVVWWPRTAAKLRVAMLWPLVEPSHRALGNDFYDDALAESVADGRLDMLLRLGDASPMPLTWVVDPELLDAVHRMGGTYTVRGTQGKGNAAAREWMERARTALREATVVSLPYGDPDLATTSAGAIVQTVDAGTAFRLGREVLQRDLGVTGSTTLAWPPGPVLSPAVESLLAAQGVKGVVVPESALPLSEVLNFTPTAPTPLAPGALGSMTALVADAQLNGWVAQRPREEGARVAVQRFLADSAITAMERPGEARDVVIAPPRDWDPINRFALQLLRQTRLAPWLEPVGLGAVLAGEPGGAARTRAPADGGLLEPRQVNRVVSLRRGLLRLRGILTDPNAAPDELAQYDDALLRAVSSAWAADSAGSARLTGSVEDGLKRQLGGLRVVAGGNITMTGRSGDIPLTFENDLGQLVRVRVRLDSNERLVIEGDTRYDERLGGEVALPPGRTTLSIPGRATTGGLFPIKVELLAQDGTRLGVGTTLKVRSTAYGAVALTVTGVAFGLLVLASATRLVRRRRDARRGRPAEPEREPQPA
jgi:hypothetical protein